MTRDIGIKLAAVVFLVGVVVQLCGGAEDQRPLSYTIFFKEHESAKKVEVALLSTYVDYTPKSYTLEVLPFATYLFEDLARKHNWTVVKHV